jgi:hypothetical protein
LERRPYFIFGDLLACSVTGAAAGWLVYAVIPGSWHPLVGMALGMLLGLPIGLVGGFIFAPLFGDLEATLPANLSAMVAGMATGMLVGMVDIGAGAAGGGGALAGLACMAYTYALQAWLHGEVR